MTIDYADIQGRVLPPQNFCVQSVCFRRIIDVASARQALAKLVGEITTAQNAIDDFLAADDDRRRELSLVNVGLTYAGMLALNSRMSGVSYEAFKEGLAARSRIIGSQRPGGHAEIDKWEVVDGNWPGAEERTAHLIVLVCGFDRAAVARKAFRVCRSLSGTTPVGFSSSVLPGEDRGAYLGESSAELREHFGFLDAISEPLKADKDGVDIIWHRRPQSDVAKLELGRFLVGLSGGRTEPLAGGVSSNSLAGIFRGGSFLVFLRLHQDVYRFHRFCTAASLWMSDEHGLFIPPLSIAEQLVGRTIDGRPLVPYNNSDINDFSFGGRSASFCPHSAHIRKANPRSPDRFSPRALTRRGMPYGPKSPSSFERPIQDYVERGMQFIALMTSIEEQFEATMRRINGVDQIHQKQNGKQALLKARIVDGLVGSNFEGTDDRYIVLRSRDKRKKKISVTVNPRTISPSCSGWCWPNAGGYFFLPTIAGFRQLISG
ncbi:hypothetical protein [Mesorhizobium sp. B2-3-15]|uniref:Dyp-type peroxidase n=1 Tax=Mesorhizobium sp. B2-3-15 TaxID=2589949 RepID=UPI001129DDA4|nr:hypothetical protein [Mesorhizobium sp. B2-3-15]TPL72295.1 hypothetical protein FJ954_16505 [Mesorhizobium sp. B2-3-15]